MSDKSIFYDLQPFDTKVFEVGDTVYSWKQPDVSGKVTSVWTDVLTRKKWLTVIWKDGKTETLLSDWVRKEPKVTFFSKEPGEEDKRPGKVHEEGYTEIGFWKISSIFADLALKLEKDLGLLDHEAENFILNSKFYRRPKNKIILKNSGIEISFDPENISNSKFGYKRNGKEISASNLLSESFTDGILIKKSGKNSYLFDWKGDKFIIGREDLISFLDEYEIDRDKVSDKLAKEGECKIKF